MKQDNKVTISFMFPVTSGVMGGVQMLLINLIPYIVNNELANVRLYDYSFGLVKQKLDEKNVTGYEYISLDDSDWSIPNKGNETFILTGGLWLSYPHFFKVKQGVNVLIWDVYYPSWQSFGKIKKFKIPFFKKNALKLLSDKNGVFFMEQKGLDFFHQNELMLDMSDDVIVPVPVYTKPSNMFLASNNVLNITDKQLVVAYIGRAVDWKMFPLKKMVDDLTVLKKTARVIVYTNDASCFSDFIGSTDAKIQLEFKEGYWGDKLAQDILCNKVNLGYAMGTAALDLANLGIPTILADFSTAEFPENYTYRFLYQASKGNLGINVCENDHTDRRTLSDIVGDFNLRAESEKSYNYVSKNHDIDNIAKKIIIVSKNSNMDLGYLSKPGALIYFLLYLLKRVFRKDNKYFGWGIM